MFGFQIAHLKKTWAHSAVNLPLDCTTITAIPILLETCRKVTPTIPFHTYPLTSVVISCKVDQQKLVQFDVRSRDV